uniref:Uncharacterized protein n=1 Tax=Arundo donax TaxID=35708 RepID=A0A0A8ZQ08_ARUDO
MIFTMKNLLFCSTIKIAH